jgi:hypothetical protein
LRLKQILAVLFSSQTYNRGAKPAFARGFSHRTADQADANDAEFFKHRSKCLAAQQGKFHFHARRQR